jgi:hypothetical protein
MPIVREIFVQELAKQNSPGTSSTIGRPAPKPNAAPRAAPPAATAPAKPKNPAALN